MGYTLPICALALLGIGVSSCSDPGELFGSTSSASQRCAEPAACPAAIADMKPKISCITPDEVRIGEATTLHVYGSFLEDARGVATKISFDQRQAEGTPTSACHLTITIPTGYFTHAGDVELVVTTDTSSDPIKLTVR